MTTKVERDGRLSGKVAIVTGSGTGIGRAIAEMFAREGARVVVSCRTELSGNETVSRIQEAGGEAVYIPADMVDEQAVHALIETTVQVFGRLDVLCNNHAVFGIDPPDFVDLTEEVWDLSMDVNAKGVFFSMKHAIPVMRHGGGGSIINISSIAALTKSVMPAYAASKAAVNALSKSVAAQVGDDGIRVNVISPSTIATERTAVLARESQYKNDLSAQARGAAGSSPVLAKVLSQMGEPDDIAYAATFLASDESSYMTAAIIPVDGGTTRTRSD